jgi:hypothetical protein
MVRSTGRLFPTPFTPNGRPPLFSLFGIILLASTAFAADLPAGETLVQRFIEQSGGAAAYARIHTLQSIGTVEVEGHNIQGTVEMVEDGEKALVTVNLAGIGKTDQGYDGETAWESNPIQGARLIEGDEKSALKRSSLLLFADSWKSDYATVKTVGEEAVGGKAAWKVEMTPKEGRLETYYFDKDSALLLRTATILATPLGEIATDVTYSDYRKLEDITFPYTVTQSVMGQSLVLHFDKIVANAPVPKDRFTLPDEVKALLAKKK